ncbi:MAG: phosphoribosyl-ATP diphosphatase [Coriobacteriia bacterium]|nr:phosphoribosyl-ATP diphosphatase [Coriobacteriia bacterium]
MTSKTYIPEGEQLRPAQSQIGNTLETLAGTIHARRSAGDKSYTYRLLTGDLDNLLKKLVEEAHETTLAAKDCDRPDAKPKDVDHLRYEAADVVYHLMVLLEREGIALDEFAAELNARMTPEELSQNEGAIRLNPEYRNRGNHVEK